MGISYDLGQGGKHRDSDDAARWRKFTAHVMNVLRESKPEMSFIIRQAYAENQAGVLARQGW